MEQEVQRSYWIDAAKLVAILGVLVDHTQNVLYSNHRIADCSYYSVGLFIFLMGVTGYGSYSRYRGSIPEKLKKNFWKIARPYLVATFIFSIAQDGQFIFLAFWKRLLYFNASAPFYYVALYLQLMVVIPVFAALLRMTSTKKGGIFFQYSGYLWRGRQTSRGKLSDPVLSWDALWKVPVRDLREATGGHPCMDCGYLHHPGVGTRYGRPFVLAGALSADWRRAESSRVWPRAVRSIHGDHAVFHGKSPIFQPWAHPGVSACFCTGEAYPIYLFIPSPVFGFPLAALFPAVEYLGHARGIFCRYDGRFDCNRMALRADSFVCKKCLFRAPRVVVRRYPKEIQEEMIRP